MTLPPEYEVLRGEVESALKDSLDQHALKQRIPQRLLDAIRYCLLAPGKRIRPILTLLACQACGGHRANALPAALAVEMIHTYSLIHDDLPAMDDDDLRRGQPTCHKAFDEATAILAGDALLTEAFHVLSEIQPAPVAVKCIRLLSEAAGLFGMVGGQMDDLLQEVKPDGTLEQLRSIHCRKTGALLRAAILLGAQIGLKETVAPEREARYQALDHYARELGLAFQIADDLLDVESTASALGKSTQKDARHGKLTYPGLLGVDASYQELSAAHLRGREALQTLGNVGVILCTVLDFVVQRKS